MEQKRSRGRPRIHPIKEPFQKYTRKNSVYDAINVLCRNGSDLKTIIAHSNKLYVQHGGTKVVDASLINITKNTLDTLVEFGYITVINKIYRFIREDD